ncbi:bacillithiol system redox-active protein YtxJ [Lutibacter holmesii]|uniref:Bacillithiol system redox-active protein YtxJ n=1 Tax=Lutibacter holmesii TaxID=1137985 RepID=A0ABW3WRU2_9FLAO
MSLFKNIFNSNTSTNKKPQLNWIPLNEINVLSELKAASNKKPILIFKHSTRCGISSMALKNFERSFDIAEEELTIYFLDLLRFREISNTIVAEFNVQHQSPQAIVIYKEKVIYHDSHYGISVEEIKNVLKTK